MENVQWTAQLIKNGTESNAPVFKIISELMERVLHALLECSIMLQLKPVKTYVL